MKAWGLLLFPLVASSCRQHLYGVINVFAAYFCGPPSADLHMTPLSHLSTIMLNTIDPNTAFWQSCNNCWAGSSGRCQTTHNGNSHAALNQIDCCFIWGDVDRKCEGIHPGTSLSMCNFTWGKDMKDWGDVIACGSLLNQTTILYLQLPLRVCIMSMLLWIMFRILHTYSFEWDINTWYLIQ